MTQDIPKPKEDILSAVSSTATPKEAAVVDTSSNEQVTSEPVKTQSEPTLPQEQSSLPDWLK